MPLTQIMELAKISPYLVLPAIFLYILWRVYKENTTFTQSIIREKTSQFDMISKRLKELTDVFTAYITTSEKETKATYDKLGDKIEHKLQRMDDKIDALILEVARKDQK